MLDYIVDYWPILVSIFSVIAFALRVEAVGRSNIRKLGDHIMATDKEIKRLWSVRKEDADRHAVERVETNHKLDQIREDTHELGKDIKDLLKMGLSK